MTVLKNLGWLEPETRDWSCVRWDPGNERLVREQLREKTAVVFESMQTLAAVPGTVVRFHPTRELQEKMTGRVKMTSCSACSCAVMEMPLAK